MKTKSMFFFLLRCEVWDEVWDEVVEQKGALPPSKSSIGSKKKSSPPKKVYYLSFLYFSYCSYFFLLFYMFFILNQNVTNIFHFGLPQCILLLVRSQIASDLCKAE